MKKNSQIISKIIAVSREMEEFQVRHEYYLSNPTDGSEKSLREREERQLDYQIKNAEFGGYLDALVWLFED